jgi:hypothetical protein
MSYEHLGVTLSSDAKWNNHIENIILSVSRHLGILRKLKYRLSRQNLEKLYLVYIRPIFEYACEIWDNCGVCYSTKLEKLQLDAARIVTGLPIFTKTDKLYSETGWTTLSSRRYNRKLQLFYNIKNGHAPNYLRELIPPTVQSTTIYPLRNDSDLIIPFCRLSITTEYFIPSTVKLWNRLDQFDCNLDTLTKFTKAIRKEFIYLFFSEFNIRLYDKNSESDYFFFLHQNQKKILSKIGNQNIFFEKNHNPPPLQVTWSFSKNNIKFSGTIIKMFRDTFCVIWLFLSNGFFEFS